MNYIEREVLARAVKMANDAGLYGRRIDVQWLPPQTASSDPYGFFIVQEKPMRSMTESWP